MKKTIYLPAIVIDSHVHGRGMDEAYKTTLDQVIYEAMLGGIDISAFMPNTKPAITNVVILEQFLRLLIEAEKKNNAKQQYLYFGATDNNFSECEIALTYCRVLGIKIYPKDPKGGTVTTGSGAIGVSSEKSILKIMRLCRRHNKAVLVHCDDPIIIAEDGYNSIRAEVEYVRKIIRLARLVPGVKIVICHVSCKQSAELILAAQAEGMQIAMEIMTHYLWFDSSGTNWRPELDPLFYKCFNNLRGPEHRLFLSRLLTLNNPLIWVASDSACHTTDEKLTKGLGGIPSNQQMVAVICTLAKQLRLNKWQIARLLNWNATDFLGITDVPKILVRHSLEERLDNAIYNNGMVTNPWTGSRLLFPVLI